MKIIFPMAGRGSRFKDVAHKNPEYLKPKPFISVRGIPMIEWAIRSLPFLEASKRTGSTLTVRAKDLIFVILKEHDEQHRIEKHLRAHYSDDITVVKLDAVTRGATETALAAEMHIDPEDSLLISDSDHFFDGTNLAHLIETKDPNTAGIIPVFKPRNEGIPKWSYTLTEKNSNRAIKVAEKDADLMNAGAFANIGAYYFTKGKYFIENAKKVIRENRTFGPSGKAEFYIAPLYQMLIEAGMKVQVAPTKEVWGLGTPEDLEYFLTHYPLI